MEHLPIMSEDECWELMGTATVGRLALSVRALPTIVPVEFYVSPVDQVIALCLGELAVPQSSGDDAIVAFSVDDIDAHTRTGWAVQVIGKSRFDVHDGSRTKCGSPASGYVMRLEPAQVTGHHLRLCPFLSTEPLPHAETDRRMSLDDRYMSALGAPSGRREIAMAKDQQSRHAVDSANRDDN
jgi:Pyridoxamine 5'-phosphate oxidase